MPSFLRRMTETFVFQFVVAAAFTMILQINQVTKLDFFKSLCFCLVLNAAFMFLCLRGYMRSIPPAFYLRVNLAVYSLFAAINICMAYFSIEPVYTYLFFPFKLLMPLGYSKLTSAIAVNAFFYVLIFITPITMPYVIKNLIESIKEFQIDIYKKLWK